LDTSVRSTRGISLHNKSLELFVRAPDFYNRLNFKLSIINVCTFLNSANSIARIQQECKEYRPPTPAFYSLKNA